MPLFKKLNSIIALGSWRQKSFSAQLLIPILIFIGLGITTEVIKNYVSLLQQSEDTKNLNRELQDLSRALEQDLSETLYFSEGLQAYIESQSGALNEHDVLPWIANLQERARFIRNIGFAPGNRISLIYPLKGNEAALGFYYPDSPEQWGEVQKVIELRQTKLVGPITLKQGGQGLILRQPIFLHDNSYWGLVSIVINSDPLFTALQNRAINNNVALFIYDLDTNQPIYGNKLVSTEKITVNLPGRHWILTGTHTESTSGYYLTIIRQLGWLLATILSLVATVYFRARKEKLAVQTELFETNTRFAQAFAASPQPLALITDQGRWLNVNKSLLQLLGYARKEIETIKLVELFEPDMRSNILAKMTALKIIAKHDDHPSEQFEAKLMSSNGNSIIGIVSLGVFYQRNQTTHWIIQIADITHRSLMEKLLKEEAQYSQSIINNMADGVVIFDTTGKIFSINNAMKKIFPLCDKFPDNLQELFHDDSGHKLMIEIESAAVEQDTIVSQRSIDCLDFSNHNLSLELDVTKVKRQEATQYIGVFRDVSERLRLDKLKNEFVSVVSHELRTPLTCISASLKLLESGALGQFDTEATKILKIATTNSHRLKLLINELLDMDKLLAGKMTFNIETCNGYELVKETIENNVSYGAHFKVDYQIVADALAPHQLNVPISVDPQRFQQVLSNLLSNAAKFSNADSTVIIKLQPDHKNLRIEVNDNGVGIDLSQQENLFKKFSQLDSSSTRSKGGTGLGLAISKELVERMGGTIGVESALGEGSCFYFTVPLAQ
jgi:PAS domain S-box-containing protein